MTQSSSSPLEEASRRFYDEFAPVVGVADWRRLNIRHEQLKLFVGEILQGSRDLRILDLGCGTGIMTAWLTRHGQVTGVDISPNAVAIARELVPAATFTAGTLDAVPAEGQFDLVTLFDVLEHVPQDDRPALLRRLAKMLAPRGRIFASTPYPDYTEWKRDTGAEELQLVDESVRLRDVLQEAQDAGLRILRYDTFDLWGGSPEYQFFVFAAEPLAPGGPPWLRRRSLNRRERLMAGPRAQLALRLRRAWPQLRHGHLRAALWTVRGSPGPPPAPRSGG